MQPNQSQDDSRDDLNEGSGIQPQRSGRMTEGPTQPHATGPTQGFIPNQESDESNSFRHASFNRSNLQSSGMQPSEDFLKEQSKQRVVAKEVNSAVKKKPTHLMTIIVGVALLIGVGSVVLVFSLVL